MGTPALAGVGTGTDRATHRSSHRFPSEHVLVSIARGCPLSPAAAAVNEPVSQVRFLQAVTIVLILPVWGCIGLCGERLGGAREGCLGPQSLTEMHADLNGLSPLGKDKGDFGDPGNSLT